MQSSRKYYQYDRSEMIAFLPEKYEKVLEIGCGEGEFLQNLKKKCEIWGIEPDKKAAEIASKKISKVLVGKYEHVSNQLPNEYFDLVICNDVIEHMEDHYAFILSIKNKIRENGYLVASIPNIRYFKNLKELLLEKDWKYRDSGILDKTHLRFFTEKSIKRTFILHGFTFEKFQGINAVKSWKGQLFFLIVNIFLGGYYRDIKYLQFGMRVRKS